MTELSSFDGPPRLDGPSPLERVHPDIRHLADLVRALPPRDLTRSVDDLRAEFASAPDMSDAMFGAHEMRDVVDVEIPVDGDTIPARIYHPVGGGDVRRGRPAHVYFHGGGFWLGDIDSADAGVRMLAARTGLTFVSVGYRLAPEHRWPVGPEDCYAATAWIADHADELGIDGSALSVGGDSAGGNLAAVVALMCRDLGGPALVAQVVSIPVVDMTLPDTASMRDFGRGFGLDRDEILFCGDLYIDEADRRHPYASPVFADLNGLAPAVVVTGECDPLCDQGREYARLLADAGVPVWHVDCPGHGHGTMFSANAFESSRRHTDEIVAAIAEARAAGAVRWCQAPSHSVATGSVQAAP